MLLAALVEAALDFIVIGGHAVAAHGYVRATRDVDIVYSTDPDNCARFSTALQKLDASIEVADTPPPGGELNSDWLAAGGHFVFATTHGPLDALSWVAGLDFETLGSGAETVELADGTRIRVCGYDDLVKMKTVGDRPRDRQDLLELEAIREEPGGGA